MLATCAKCMRQPSLLACRCTGCRRCRCVRVTVPLIHTHPFNGRLTGTTRVSRYQKGKTNLDFTEARDTEWQVCTSLQTDNHTSTPPLSFLQAGCPSCRPTNSVKALKADSSNALGRNFRSAGGRSQVVCKSVRKGKCIQLRFKS